MFHRLTDECSAFLAEIGLSSRHFVLISVRDGDNIVRRSERTGFYGGPTVLEALGELKVLGGAAALPPRLPLQDV